MWPVAWESGVSCGEVSGFLPVTDQVWPEICPEPLHWKWQIFLQQQGAEKLLEEEVTKSIAKGRKQEEKSPEQSCWRWSWQWCRWSHCRESLNQLKSCFYFLQRSRPQGNHWKGVETAQAYLIFVTNITNGVCGEKFSCGENFPYDRLSCGEVSPQEKFVENLSHRESSPHDKCGAKCVMWRNVEKSVMWRNFPHDRFLHMRNEKCQANVLCGGISPYDRFLHTSSWSRPTPWWLGSSGRSSPTYLSSHDLSCYILSLANKHYEQFMP